MNIIEDYKDFCREIPNSGSNGTLYGINRDQLNVLLSKIGISLSEDSFSFFLHSIPSSKVGSGKIAFLDAKGIEKNNTILLPGCETVRFGFMCFATSGNGGNYVLHSKTDKVYFIDVGKVFENELSFKNGEVVPTSEEGIIKISTHQWDGIPHLIAWARTRLKEVMRDEKK